MTDRDRVLAAHPDATCFTLAVFGHTAHMIRVNGRDFTGWCGTEERAWALAARLLKRIEGRQP